VLRKEWVDPHELWAFSDKQFELAPFGFLTAHGRQSKEDPHFAVTLTFNGEPVTFCSCKARWTHAAERGKNEVFAVYTAHLRYFNRPPTLVL